MIKYLESEQELKQIARWLFDEWGYARPGSTVESVIERLRPRICSTVIPLTFLAVEDGLVGTASLVESDMTTHPELTPWLSSLYVRADARGRGVGDALLRKIVAEASRLGHRKLYLWTDKAERFYESRGWRVVLREDYRGESAVVMEIDIQWAF